jgi:Concanavalin A-like lectin/glucanases superfamily
MKYFYPILFSILIAFSCVKQDAPESAPTVITLEPSDIRLNSFSMSGDVTNEGFNATKDRGFVWSLNNNNPSVSDNKISVGYGKGQYSLSLEKLSPNTTYYYKAFATNDKGTSYGELKVVKTADYSLATLTTDLPKNITYTSAELGGNVVDEGGIAVTERGICLAINKTPTVSDIKIINGKGLGSFANIVIRLIEGTNYSVRTYAINGKGASYGNEQKFTTLAIKAPAVSTELVSNIAATYVTLQGKVTDNGGTDLVEKGFCVSKNTNPSINDIRVKASNTDANAYAIVLTALDPQTKYFVRAYAQNSKGISYGNELSFTTTPATIPTVGTNDFQDITQNSVRAGVEINNNGGADIIEFGVCLSTNRFPTIYDRKVVLGTGNSPGKMENFGGLTANTTYYLRGYAINRVGVAYGPERSFTTINPVTNTLKNGLVAYYPFNGNVNDVSGNNFHGTPSQINMSTDRNNESGKAISLNGQSFLEIPHDNRFNGEMATISVWYNAQSYTDNGQGNQRLLVSKRDPSGWGGGYEIGLNNNNGQGIHASWTNSGGNGAILYSNNLNISQWYHYVYVHDRNTVKLYLNGSLVKEMSNTGMLTSNNLPTRFGQRPNGWHPFIGKLDDIGIWNRALTPEEINYLYQNNFQP